MFIKFNTLIAKVCISCYILQIFLFFFSLSCSYCSSRLLYCWLLKAMVFIL